MREELKLQLLHLIEEKEKEYDYYLSDDIKDFLILKLIEWNIYGQTIKKD